MKNIFILFFVFLCSCCSLQSPFNVEVTKPLPLTSHVTINNKIDVVFLDHSKQKINGLNREATASGFVIKKTKDGSYVLTAGHACSTDEMLEDLRKQVKFLHIAKTIAIKTFKNEVFKAKVIKVHKKRDICLMFVKGLTNLPTVQVSKKPLFPGDRVYNIASPMGISDQNFYMIYEGFYSGQKKLKAWYTFYSTGGSSGSMILNKRGRLVGIVTHSSKEILMSLGPTRTALFDFIKKNID